MSILNGLKVLEYGSFVSAPYCARLLADLGAEVLKIERPDSGDLARSHGPFPDADPDPERSGLFLYVNLNKRGVTLDLEQPAGQELFRRLAAEADVLVENTAPGYLAGLGLGYDQLRELNSRLIVTSITPFGQTGPYSQFKGYDINVCAFSGICFSIGEPGRAPLTMPLSQAEYQGALGGAAATMAALLARDRTGRGQHLDVASTEVFATIHMGGTVLTYLFQGVTGHRAGHRRADLYPTTILPCKDGYVCLICREGRQWKTFLQMMGNPAWMTNPRYRDRRAIAEQFPDEMDALVMELLGGLTREQFFQMCLEWHVPFAPVRTVDEVFADPHLAARDFFVEVEHPRAGALRYPGVPYQFSSQPRRQFTPAPLLGEHNQAVFGQELGLGQQRLSELQQAGVI